MYLKRIFPVLGVIVGLAIVFTPVAQALTLQEIQAAQAQVLGDVTYPTVTVTSATNQSLLVTATPLTYNGSTWQYNFIWNRVRSADGSFYVRQKTGSQAVILAIDSAAKQGSALANLPPSTSYYVEFYSKPFSEGVLLLRKTLNTRAAESTFSGISGSTNYSGTQSNLTNTSTNVKTETMADLIKEKYGIVWNTTNLPIDQNSNSSANPYSPTANYPEVPTHVALAKIDANGGEGVAWVGIMLYTDGRGNCYKKDVTSGSPVIQKITCYANHPLPTLVNGEFPQINSETFPWHLSNAVCYYSYGRDKIQTGQSRWASCLERGFVDKILPIQLDQQVVTEVNGLPMHYPTDPRDPYSRARQQNAPIVDISVGLRKINANGGNSINWVGVFNYTNGQGKCFTRDATSGIIYTDEIPCYANYPLPVWTRSGMPDWEDSTFNWERAHGICYYSAGRLKPLPGATHSILCTGGETDPSKWPLSLSAPVNPLIQLPSPSDTIKVVSLDYRSSPALGGTVSCQRYFVGKTASGTEYTTRLSIPCNYGAMLPVLEGPQIPSGHDANFDWVNANAKCVNKNSGQETKCGMPVGQTSVDGTCGSAASQVFSSLNSTASNLCAYGSVVNFSGTGPWAWNCQGNNGGLFAYCKAYTQATTPAQSPTLPSSTNLKGGSGKIIMPQFASGYFNLSSSNPYAVRLSDSTVYVGPGAESSVTYTCLASGSATITVSGYGYPTTTQTVTCN